LYGILGRDENRLEVRRRPMTRQRIGSGQGLAKPPVGRKRPESVFGLSSRARHTNKKARSESDGPFCLYGILSIGFSVSQSGSLTAALPPPAVVDVEQSRFFSNPHTTHE